MLEEVEQQRPWQPQGNGEAGPNQPRSRLAPGPDGSHQRPVEGDGVAQFQEQLGKFAESELIPRSPVDETTSPCSQRERKPSIPCFPKSRRRCRNSTVHLGLTHTNCRWPNIFLHPLTGRSNLQARAAPFLAVTLGIHQRSPNPTMTLILPQQLRAMTSVQ